MMWGTHAATGAVAGLGYCAYADLSPAATIGFTLVATAASWLPDIDNTRLWRLLDRWVPDEMFGNGGAMRHRGITHFWAWPALMVWVALKVPIFLLIGTHQVDMSTALMAFAVGVLSHLAGDFVVGAGSKFRDAGIPMLPWWGHVGLGFHCEGGVEKLVGCVVMPAAAVVLLLGLTGVDITALVTA